MKVQEGLILVAIYFSLAYTQLVKGQPRKDCQTRCGNVSIEYPFGISSGCYYPGDDSFNLTCKEDRPHVLRDIEVNNFYHSGEVQVLLNRSSTCYDEQGKETISGFNFTLDNLTLSAKNKFTVVGCNALALLGASGKQNYATGCISACDSLPAGNGKCNGVGCCRSEFSFPLDSYAFKADSSIRIPNLTSVHQFNPCTYAFLVEDGMFNFSSSEDLWNLRNVTRFPAVLDWSIGEQTCEQVGNTSICGGNSKCFNSTTRNGYICICNEGFDGNPYLSDGCQDINECTNPIHRHNCSGSSTCENRIGSFECKCPSGYRLDTTTMSCAPSKQEPKYLWTTVLGKLSLPVADPLTK